MKDYEILASRLMEYISEHNLVQLIEVEIAERRIHDGE